MKRTIQKGFTLIELMIVIAIIGILAAIAIPMYQDYTVRTKVTEAINVAAPCKLAMAEYYSSQSGWPADTGAAGCQSVNTVYVSGIAVAGNVLTVTMQAPPQVNGGTIILTATAKDSAGAAVAVGGTAAAVDWVCSGGGVLAGAGTKFLPSSCRGVKS